MPFDTNQDSYLSLRSIIAERTSNILVWIGSGLSIAAGAPTWVQLKGHLVAAFRSQSPDGDTSTTYNNDLSEIEKDEDLWRSFSRLHRLGPSTYRSIIRKHLTINASTPTPSICQNLWRLPVSGVINLNLDHLANRACFEATGKAPIVFNGRKAGSLLHIHREQQPFIAHLHGQVEDRSSWVFTHEELNELLADEGYITFINTCLSAYTVIFLGIRANDIAAGGFLERLRSLGCDPGCHFWVTAQKDPETLNWAERTAGIRIIKYRSNDTDHSELDELFSDLFTFVPADDVIVEPALIVDPQKPPSNRTENDYQELPSPEELATEDAETIRLFLNIYAEIMLRDNSRQAYEKYENFRQIYDEAIYRAWYTSTVDGKNNLLDYTLLREVASGAFGTVYEAIDCMGNKIAIKKLHQEVRTNPELLQSFRRGVRSMKILGESGIKGMANYRRASEIPAFVAMDFIDGCDLKNAIVSGRLKTWEEIAYATLQIVTIIHSAHFLPQRVLHRDIRPSNVMLEESDSQYGWELVILDFDLSWHKGSYEKSVLHGSAMLGYLSPEQLDQKTNVSTRHSSVDSFGIGMTCFFMVSRRDPLPAEHQHRNWEDTVRAACNELGFSDWSSLPSLFARFIIGATRHNQHERHDLPGLLKEISRIYEAINNPSGVRSAGIISEEIAARSCLKDTYVWNSDTNSVEAKLVGDRNIALRGDESEGTINLTVVTQVHEVQDRKKPKRWVTIKNETVKDILKKHGWTIKTRSRTPSKTVSVDAKISARNALQDLDNLAASLDQVASELR